MSDRRPTDPTLDAAPFVLRPYRESDAAAMASGVRESVDSVGTWMPWAVHDYSEALALDWFAITAASRAAGSAHEFGIFDATTGAFVGGAGLNQFNTLHGFCNLGYWVRASAQRNGAALASVRALARFAFDTLGQTRVEIVVADGNAPSRALAEKAGALYETLARNRLRLHAGPVAAHVYSLVP